MSKVIKWRNLADKDKVNLILQHIFGCFIYEDEQRHEEIRGIDAHNAGFHYPHAYWDQGVERWCVKDVSSDPEMFDPLHDMNDAWKIIRWLWQLHTHENAYDREIEFLGYLSGMISSEDGVPVGPFSLHDLATLTPEDICIAALLAFGVQVDTQ